MLPVSFKLASECFGQEMFLGNKDANEAKEDKDHQDGQESSWIIINQSKFSKNKTVDLYSGTLKNCGIWRRQSSNLMCIWCCYKANFNSYVPCSLDYLKSHLSLTVVFQFYSCMYLTVNWPIYESSKSSKILKKFNESNFQLTSPSSKIYFGLESKDGERESNNSTHTNSHQYLHI